MKIGNLANLEAMDQAYSTRSSGSSTRHGDFSQVLDAILTRPRGPAGKSRTRQEASRLDERSRETGKKTRDRKARLDRPGQDMNILKKKETRISDQDRDDSIPDKDLLRLIFQFLILDPDSRPSMETVSQGPLGDLGWDNHMYGNLLEDLEEGKGLEAIIDQLLNLDQGLDLGHEKMPVSEDELDQILAAFLEKDMVQDQDSTLAEIRDFLLGQGGKSSLEDMGDLTGDFRTQLINEILDGLREQDGPGREEGPDLEGQDTSFRLDLDKGLVEVADQLEKELEETETIDPGTREKKLEDLDQGLEETGLGRDIFHMDRGFPRIENLVNQLDLDGQDMDLGRENLEKVSSSIIQSMDFSRQGKSNLVEVDLYPRELGSLTIKLELEEGRLRGRILVDNEGVRKLVLASMDQLDSNLERENIRLEEVEVDIRQDLSQSFNQQEDSPNSQEARQGLDQGPRHYLGLRREGQTLETIGKIPDQLGQGLVSQSLNILV